VTGPGECDPVVVSEVRGVRVLALPEGDLTAAEASRVRTALEEHIQDGGFVLDLGKIRFIDSSGIGVIVGAHRALLRAGSEMRIARPSREASAAFELVRLHRLLEIHPALGDAVEAFDDGGR